jgi:hypothetical protein
LTLTINNLEVIMKKLNGIQISSDSVSDDIIGNRTLLDENESSTLVAVESKSISSWLQAFRNNLKWLFANNVNGDQALLDEDENPVLVSVESKSVASWLQMIRNNLKWLFSGKANLESPVFTGTPKVPSKTSAPENDGTLIATEAQLAAEAEARIAADNDEVVARNEAIATAQLSNHVWLPAINVKANLPSPATLNPGLNYLCRVMTDSVPANNGVWQLIAGNDEWTYFSDNLDFIDETELDAALKTTLTDDAASTILPATTISTFSSLLQSIRNCLKWLFTNKVDKNGTDRLMTAAEGTKLSGIESGAQVNTNMSFNTLINLGNGYMRYIYQYNGAGTFTRLVTINGVRFLKEIQGGGKIDTSSSQIFQYFQGGGSTVDKAKFTINAVSIGSIDGISTYRIVSNGTAGSSASLWLVFEGIFTGIQITQE